MSIVSEMWTLAELSSDENALKNLASDLYSRCLRIARGNYILSEDIAQHVLYKACETEEVFLGYESFKKWSNKCAKNMFLDHVKKAARQNSEKTYRGRTSSGRLRQTQTEEIGTEEKLDQRIATALIAIPLIYRQIIGKFAEDKTYKEIALDLDLSQGNVRSKLHRARGMLRPRLSEVYKEYFGKTYANSK